MNVARFPLRRLGPVLLALLGPGCAVTPAGPQPAVELPETWTDGTGAQIDPQAEPDDDWWSRFEDPALTGLVLAARTGNRTVEGARARLAEARAIRDAAAGGRWPSVAARGAANRQRLSENGALPVRNIPGFDPERTIYEAGFDARWELDLFGRVENRLAAAQARSEAAAAAVQDAELSISAEVVRNYVELRGAQLELAARRVAIEAAEQTLLTVRTQHRLGAAPAAAVAGAEAELAVERSPLPALQQRVRAAALALGALTGNAPGSALNLSGTADPAVQLWDFPVGTRAAVLARRPDVRAAERRLVAAAADVAVAKAELYPQLVIGASGGFESLSTDTLFDHASRAWSLVPSFRWRLFEGGRVRAEIRISEARAAQAALAYEQTVLDALTEAETSLSRYQADLTRIDLAAAARSAAERSHQLTDIRYRAGDVTLLELTDAQRRLSRSRESLAAARTAAAVSLVTVIKSLGGGWR